MAYCARKMDETSIDREAAARTGRWAAVRTVSHNRLLTRCLSGLFAFAITEQGCWLAILLFAYNRGGVAEVGWVAALMLAPTALLAPLVAVSSDFLPRHRVLTAGYALIAVSSVSTGAAMLAEAPIAVIYGLAVTFSILLTFAGPATASIIPTAATTADELTAANTATGLAETTGRLAGPLVAGAILTVASAGSVLMWIGALMGVGALTTVGRTSPGSDSRARHDDDPERRSATVELTAGMRLLGSDKQVRALTGAIATTAWIAGALDVGAAVIAIDILQQDDAAVSVLLTGFGAGGLLGSAVSFALVGRHRLAIALAGSVIVMCAAFASVGWSPNLASATLLLVVVGAGVTLTSVAGRTMLQGLTPDDTLARLFGVLEALESVALALGGLALSMLATRLSLPNAFLVVGGTGIVGLAVMWQRLVSIDRARRPIEPILLRIARSSPVFGPLPPYAMEQALSSLVRESLEPGAVLMRRGDRGDRMCLLAAGSLTVDTGFKILTRSDPGTLIGEIAIVRDTPRTADVTAGDTGAVVYWMDAAAFVRAVDRVPRSQARLHAEVERRLDL